MLVIVVYTNDKYTKDRIYRCEVTEAYNEMVLDQVLLSVECASKPTAGLELAWNMEYLREFSQTWRLKKIFRYFHFRGPLLFSTACGCLMKYTQIHTNRSIVLISLKNGDISCLAWEKDKRARKKEKETNVKHPHLSLPWLCSFTQPCKVGIHILTDESREAQKGDFTQSDTLRCGSAEI